MLCCNWSAVPLLLGSLKLEELGVSGGFGLVTFLTAACLSTGTACPGKGNGLYLQRGKFQGVVRFPWGELFEFIALSSFLLKLVFQLCLQT